jgi:hypothetical protein
VRMVADRERETNLKSGDGFEPRMGADLFLNFAENFLIEEKLSKLGFADDFATVW